GVPVASFRLAVDRPFTNEQGERETDFLPVVAWRNLAEVCANNLTKGRLVAVQGRIQTRSFQAQDGTTRWITEIVADNIRFLHSPKAAQNGARQNGTQANGQPAQAPVVGDGLDYSSAMPIGAGDNDYPF